MNQLSNIVESPNVSSANTIPSPSNADTYFGNSGYGLFEYLDTGSSNNPAVMQPGGQNLSVNPFTNSRVEPPSRLISPRYSGLGLSGFLLHPFADLGTGVIIDPLNNVVIDPFNNPTGGVLVWTWVENSSAPLNLKKRSAESEVISLAKARVKSRLSTYSDKYSKRNWDGFDADPITQETIAATEIILTNLSETFNNPDIAPGADGSIGLEWIFQDGPLRKLFIDIGPGKFWSVYWQNSNGKSKSIPRKEISRDINGDLKSLFSELSN